MKTHSGVKKRVKLTKNGKLRRHKTSAQHEQVRRRKGRPYEGLAEGQAKRMSKLLAGYDRD